MREPGTRGVRHDGRRPGMLSRGSSAQCSPLPAGRLRLV